MHASDWKKKPLAVLKRIKTISSTLYEINLPLALNEDN